MLTKIKKYSIRKSKKGAIMKFDYYKPIEQQITIQDFFENMINQNIITNKKNNNKEN